MKEKISTKDFAIRVSVIAVSALIVLFFINLWIIKPLVTAKAKVVFVDKPQISAKGKCASKERVKIKWQDAASHIGEYVITEGEIVAAHNTGKVCYLNFHKNYTEYLTLVIFESAFKKFPKPPEKLYLGKKIRVEGRIKTYKGRLEIIVDSTAQLGIINN